MSAKPLRKPIVGRRGGILPAGKPRNAVAGGRAGVGASSADDSYLYVAGIRDSSKRITEFSTEKDMCPICRTDRQFNKNLRLLVSPCYHKMCEGCIDRNFFSGPAPCPVCGKILRRTNYAHQTFEDLKVEKEVSVRKRISEQYNKRSPDFQNRREYDDYLEDVEEITFNLLNDVDLEETEARIAEFSRKNAAAIALNKDRAALEALSQAERDEVEKRARRERRRMVEEAERVEATEKAKMEQQVTEAVGRGDQARAKVLREEFARTSKARAEALEQAVPPSLMAAAVAKEGGAEANHSPNSPSYNGPYVPIPWDDPEQAAWTTWYERREEYTDSRPEVFKVKGDKDGRFKAGGYELGTFWEMEVRAAMDNLGIEPLA